jgi:hypothetical protein
VPDALSSVSYGTCLPLTFGTLQSVTAQLSRNLF